MEFHCSIVITRFLRKRRPSKKLCCAAETRRKGKKEDEESKKRDRYYHGITDGRYIDIFVDERVEIIILLPITSSYCGTVT
mmetsp:Transcript_18816/g.34692  ORF Transcript_18816/g.34692 Transcript_18816/m.34692 type:complete len:81 (+) Transcript_18816:548-790(+)